MDTRIIKLTESAFKYGNLNLRSCGKDFFPPDVFGGPNKKSGLGNPITLKVEGLDKEIKTDIPTDAKTHKPCWIFRERGWAKKFVNTHGLNSMDSITITRDSFRMYSIIPDGKNSDISLLGKSTFSPAEFSKSVHTQLAQVDKYNSNNLHKLLGERSNHNGIVSVLSRLGHLPKNFDGRIFLPLLKHPNYQVRYWAARNLGKLKNINYLKLLSNVALYDANSTVRREAASSIGRMRSEISIPVLKKILKDKDPKVVLQAIRALFVFKSKPEIKDVLLRMSNHPNEIIESVINSKFRLSKQSTSKVKHTESPNFIKNVIVRGDVLEVLKYIPAESVHLSFTSPPYYNARDYTTYQSYEEYLEFLSKVFKELHRVTKEGRFFILNTSPIIIPRVSRNHSSKRYPIPFDIHPHLVKNGWDFIDDIIWEKPEVCAKNRNAGFLQHRKPLGYKPNPITEYLMVYRKKTNELIDWCMKQYNRETINKSKVQGKYETSNVWKVEPTSSKIHSAVFPEELCRRVISFYSYIGDLVFDPFGGIGTLGKAAIKMSRNFFITEINDKYIQHATRELTSLGLLSDKKIRLLTVKDIKNHFLNIKDEDNR